MVEISAIGNASLFFRQDNEEVNADNTALQAANNTAAAEDNSDQNTVNTAGEGAETGNNAFKALATVESPNDDNDSSEKPQKTEGRKEGVTPIPGSFSQQSLRGLAGEGAISPQTAKEIRLHGIPPSVQAKVTQLSIEVAAERKEAVNNDILNRGIEVLNELDALSGELELASSVPNEGTALVPPGTSFATQV